MPATPTQVKVQSLKELQAVIRQFCTERDWDQFHNAKDMALSLVLESAEFLEHFQWRNGEEIDAYLKQHKADAAEELADVFYWVLRIADKLDIDLPATLSAKMRKNALKYPVDKAKGSHKKYTELK
jgi:NTP pyrophosphatase (non-canonical NTP hydrolase)